MGLYVHATHLKESAHPLDPLVHRVLALSRLKHYPMLVHLALGVVSLHCVVGSLRDDDRPLSRLLGSEVEHSDPLGRPELQNLLEGQTDYVLDASGHVGQQPDQGVHLLRLLRDLVDLLEFFGAVGLVRIYVGAETLHRVPLEADVQLEALFQHEGQGRLPHLLGGLAFPKFHRQLLICFGQLLDVVVDVGLVVVQVVSHSFREGIEVRFVVSLLALARLAEYSLPVLLRVTH